MNIYTVSIGVKYEGESLYTAVDDFEVAMQAKDDYLKNERGYNEWVEVSQWQNGKVVWTETFK